MGNKQDQEWVKLRKQYLDGEVSWEQVLDEYNNPDNYIPQLPSTNKTDNGLKLNDLYDK